MNKANPISREDFENLVAQAFDRLPEWVRQKVQNVAVIAEDVVDEETMLDMGLESNMDLLGLYRGVPLTERNYEAGLVFPDVIFLYKLPIEEEAVESDLSVRDVVYETLWHEIAHHFGLDEDAVQKREGEEFRV
ncbi:MAG: metallopeptidase family protein [Candidatus Paceibacterota bacterium]|jgi:predicted Zn-dependent protease with MMP-like domain